MKIKALKDYVGKIEGCCYQRYHCNEMLVALDASYAEDVYQDTQPGGGSCARDNRNSTNEYEKLLGEQTTNSVFGALYDNASPDEKALLDALLNSFWKRYDAAFVCYDEIGTTYQMRRFMEFLCEQEFAEKEMELSDISLIEAGGDHFVALVAASWDEAKMEFLFAPTDETAKEFLERMMALAATAQVIVETLKNRGFDDCTNSSGYFVIREFEDGSERCVDVYKSTAEGTEPAHYTVYCSYENENSDYACTEDLSVEALEKVLRKLAAA